MQVVTYRANRHVWRSCSWLGIVPLVALLLCGSSRAADEPAPKKKSGILDEVTVEAEEETELVISADTVDASFGDRVARFKGNVQVDDVRVTLTADEMIVKWSKEDEIEHIQATGDVVIQQTGGGGRATGGKAEFDVVKGTIVLSEKPKLEDKERGTALIGVGEPPHRLVYSRENDRFETKGGRFAMKMLVPAGKAEKIGSFLGGGEEKK